MRWSRIYQREPVPPGEELLRVENLTRKGKLEGHLASRSAPARSSAWPDLIGAGRTELCRAIFGVDPIDSGQDLPVDGQPVQHPLSPRRRARRHRADPEDRQRDRPRAAPAHRRERDAGQRRPHQPLRLSDRRRERQRQRRSFDRAAHQGARRQQLAGRFSGGNQQKVVIAKWLFRKAPVFLFDEPTRGIDVGAKVEVFEVMDELARAGAAILMVSSEMAELLQVADRILVMRQGRITGELPGRTTQEEIMRLRRRWKGAEEIFADDPAAAAVSHA